MQNVLNENIPYEIAIDESGRGPLFGRLYTAAVVLPKADFTFDKMIDSKKIKSKKRMAELASYIKANAVAYSIQFVESDVIDKINILQANMQCMHECIKEIINMLHTKYPQDNPIHQMNIIVDGNYFKPFSAFDNSSNELYVIPHTTIEQGDNKYHNIAAASILAKHARDSYIEHLCNEHPYLKEHYSLHTNMGYGTKAHMGGIKTYGITKWHRQSFSPCKISL